MAMAISVPHYTVDDLERFPDDGNRYELLDGVLLVTPAPVPAHQIVATRIAVQLHVALQESAHAEVVAPGAVEHGDNTQLQPDILVFPSRYAAAPNWKKIGEHWLAVEVLSPSSRMYDREFKRDAYLKLGVREVWLVDLWEQHIEVCTALGKTRKVRTRIRFRPPVSRQKPVEIDLGEVFKGLHPVDAID